MKAESDDLIKIGEIYGRRQKIGSIFMQNITTEIIH